MAGHWFSAVVGALTGIGVWELIGWIRKDR